MLLKSILTRGPVPFSFWKCLIQFVVATSSPAIIVWCRTEPWADFGWFKLLLLAWAISTLSFAANLHTLAGALSGRDIELADEIRQLKAEVHILKTEKEDKR